MFFPPISSRLSNPPIPQSAERRKGKLEAAIAEMKKDTERSQNRVADAKKRRQAAEDQQVSQSTSPSFF